MAQYRSQPKKLIALLSILFFLIGGGLGWLFIGPFLNQQTDQSPSQTPEQPTQNTLACIEALPNTTLITQKLMFATYSEQIADQTKILASTGVGGIIVMDQTDATAIDELTSRFAITPFVAVDQEGGTVQRYKNNGPRPSAASVAANLTPEQAYEAYLQDAKHLRSSGITTNFAPVVDVVSRLPSPLPSRMFSADPETVSVYATQAVVAAQTAGIAPVVKHFPGLGSATGNTDVVTATTDSLATLKTRDLIPYQRLASLKPDVMVSNAIVPDLTNGMPAVWSQAAVTLLRNYGYEDSVVYSDSLTAKAIPGPLDEATIKAWQAGIDVAVIVQDRPVSTQVHTYVDTITTRAITALENDDLNRVELARSVERIFARKHINPCSIK